MRLEQMSDEELMTMYQNGTEEAFKALYHRHAAKIFGFVKSRIQNKQRAEDIFQEVFVRVHKSKHLYNQSFPLLPWIFTITKNVIIDFYRSSELKISSTEFKGEVNFSPAFDTSATAHDFTNLLADLPVNQKQAIQLRYFEEKTFDEIASRLKTSPLNVRQLISRGLKRIRQLLGEEVTNEPK